MWTEDFLLRGLLGGAAAALVAGPLGCFVVWRRMAYFGDALAHSALLGVALGFLLGLDLRVGSLAVCLVLALLLVLLQRPDGLASDTALGILAHTALAAGLVAVSLMERLRADLMGYLFGDILAVTPGDLAWIWGGGAVVLAGLAWLWRDLLALTVHEELAQAEGVPALRVRFLFMGLIALAVAIAMKIVGVLLITSLLIIPAAAARRLARTPEQMALLASLLGLLAVAGGLAASLRWDTPAGPSVVLAAALLFALSALAPLRAR
ncbi:MAG: zinc ABC transporter permease subunit ZnuB [Candidatus Tectomicrobia bacterium]|uniref:High-affinity zinc uptake system membrane protein ZnuB n=1 Tax=Tectimicrobiota bacterium TaxID=2528274 RepID=A0A932I3S7_UNCTE|nr:zinc ABC transporter permease subunit ZnuB [Candidatus Tectomicrobia bacterium]